MHRNAGVWSLQGMCVEECGSVRVHHRAWPPALGPQGASGTSCQVTLSDPWQIIPLTSLDPPVEGAQREKGGGPLGNLRSVSAPSCPLLPGPLTQMLQAWKDLPLSLSRLAALTCTAHSKFWEFSQTQGGLLELLVQKPRLSRTNTHSWSLHLAKAWHLWGGVWAPVFLMLRGFWYEIH